MSTGRLHIQRSSTYRRVAEMSASFLSSANPVRCVGMSNGNAAIEVHLTHCGKPTASQPRLVNVGASETSTEYLERRSWLPRKSTPSSLLKWCLGRSGAH